MDGAVIEGTAMVGPIILGMPVSGTRVVGIGVSAGTAVDGTVLGQASHVF